MSFYKFFRPLIFSLSAENAHNLAIKSLKYNLVPPPAKPAFSGLANEVFGLKFNNPVGLAAGFDKNGEAIGGLLSQGFGFIEVGTCTPLAQPGNPKPRLFRLEEDNAIINRFGFNNKGAENFVENLKKRTTSGIVGANIGKNKASTDEIADYVTMLEKVYNNCNYVTINISSPNTPGLRNLQGRESLDRLLGAVMAKGAELNSKTPILLKVSPDTSAEEREDIAEISLKHNINGLIISNTTISRNGLKSKYAGETGGLSGKPLLNLSTEALKEFYKLTSGKIPLIGVGGISSGDDAYAKIKSGASLVQIYSVLIYEGFGIIPRINERISELLHKEGFRNIKEAIGADAI